MSGPHNGQFRVLFVNNLGLLIAGMMFGLSCIAV
jgi:hypothetical protein